MLYRDNYCVPCDRHFTWREDLEKHWTFSSSHSWCKRCNRFFKCDADLSKHKAMSNSHWECSKCELDFATRQALHSHRISDDSHNWCEDCQRDFSAPSQLRSHRLTHLNRDIACYGCGDNQRFATFSAMLVHLESGNCSTTIEELDKYAAQCFQHKKYVVPGHEFDLRNGRRYIKRPGGRFYFYRRIWKCNECDKEFQREGQLQQHLDSPVHDDCSYKCPGCDTMFKVLSGLVQHVESEACGEGVRDGTGSIGKMLHYIRKRV